MNPLPPRLSPATWFRPAFIGIVLTVGPASAPALEITLPPETTFFQPSALPGYAAATASCVNCHSADYIRTQPPTPAATWKTEVLKMKKVYGAPIPDEQVDPIADYLFQTYGPGKSVPASGNSPPGK
jgi:hypothetical protein